MSPRQAATHAVVLAIIQAHTGSVRLPGKVLLDLAGFPVLVHVIERVKLSRLTDKFAVATTINPADLSIVDLCTERGVCVYCGDELDPLERYYRAARLYGGDHIVRIKADCPAIDPEIIDEAIRLHLRSGADYTGNTLERTFPVGQDVEILSRPALERVWRNAAMASEREHVTLYIANHPEAFNIAHLTRAPNLAGKRWTLDYPEDYELMRPVFRELYPRNPAFGMQAILDFLSDKPELEQLNAHIPVDAGVRISVANDHPAWRPS